MPHAKQKPTIDWFAKKGRVRHLDSSRAFTFLPLGKKQTEKYPAWILASPGSLHFFFPPRVVFWPIVGLSQRQLQHSLDTHKKKRKFQYVQDFVLSLLFFSVLTAEIGTGKRSGCQLIRGKLACLCVGCTLTTSSSPRSIL